MGLNKQSKKSLDSIFIFILYFNIFIKTVTWSHLWLFLFFLNQGLDLQWSSSCWCLQLGFILCPFISLICSEAWFAVACSKASHVILDRRGEDDSCYFLFFQISYKCGSGARLQDCGFSSHTSVLVCLKQVVPRICFPSVCFFKL